MKYSDPTLRETLAGAYVMGTLPRRAAARFERLMADDPALGVMVTAWRERLAPLDATAALVEPPARVWRAVAREIEASPARMAAIAIPAATDTPRWWDRVAIWRGLAFGALALAAASLALYVAVPRPAPTIAELQVVAVLTDSAGIPAWIATAEPQHSTVALSAIRSQPLPPDRSFELWTIAGGPPRSLGLLREAAGSRVSLAANKIPHDGVLAVSLEPRGGSPTGAPTGPVLYRGKILK